MAIRQSARFRCVRVSVGRGGAAADSFLNGYKGILQTDGYIGYDNAAKGVAVHAGCWAHLRRYFVDAVKVNKLDAVAADFVVEMDKVFAVDREAAEGKLTLAERHVLRQERTKPIVENIRKKLLAAKAAALPKSKLGEGIGYGLSQWPQLIAFLDHAEIELSNNLAENSMRPVALGRKNWIQVGSVDAGPRVAAILSVVETCRRLDIPVREYLVDVLPGLADSKASHVAELTPMAWKLRRSGRPGFRGESKAGDGRTRTFGKCQQFCVNGISIVSRH